jgi:hypothetical protein
VPVLLWKGKEEPVIYGKGERVAKARGWEIVAVEGDHNHGGGGQPRAQPFLPTMLRFMKREVPKL